MDDFAQIVTLTLVSNCSFASIFRKCRTFEKFSKEPGFGRLYYGRWTENEANVDLIITWRSKIDATQLATLQNTTLRHLSPFKPYLRPDSRIAIFTLSGSPLSRLWLSREGGAYTSIGTFHIRIDDYAADPHIEENLKTTFEALVCGGPRHGSNYTPPPEEEIPLQRRIATATGTWDGGWVSDAGTIAEKDVEHKRFRGLIQWERPQLETAFKARRRRHGHLSLQTVAEHVRGIDDQGPDVDEQLWEAESKDLDTATKSFWKPITETWASSFEEHHSVFEEVTAYTHMGGKGSDWLSCVIQ